jgi:hypothetical protein
VSKKPASTKKAAPKKKVVAKKPAPAPKKKVVAKKPAPAPKKKAAAKKAAVAPKKTAVARKPAPAPKKKAVVKAPAPAPKEKVVAKAAVAPKKGAAARPAATSPVKAHAWKDVSVALGDDVHKVIFFDWETLKNPTRDPSPTAKYQPDRNPNTWFEDFEEYILGNWPDPVAEGDWEPIAVVGLGHASTTESFAEMNNRGFLAVVREGGSFPEGTVLWLDGPRYHKDEPFIAAPHVDALKITRR